MARTKSQTQQPVTTRPFMTEEGQEKYLVSLANNLVEKRLLEGTASSQEVTHFLKLGSRNAQLELEKLEQENELLRAKTESLKSQKHVEELYTEAMTAFRSYSGQGEVYEEY